MDRKKAIALSFSVPVAWGFSYPLMKIGMDSMNATSIVALRCIIAFVACLLLFHKHALRINRDVMVRSAIIGAIMATELTCMCLGSSLTSASTAGFLQSLTVVIVPFANAALLRRAPERKVLVGTAIVTCGMLLLSGADFTSLNPGALIMLLSAFVYAGHIIVAKRFVEDVDPLALGVWQLGFGGLFSGIAAFGLWRFHASRHAGRGRSRRCPRTHLLCLWLYHPDARAAPRARRDHRLRFLTRTGLLCRLLVLPGRRGPEPHRLLWRRPHPHRRHGGNRRASAPPRTWTGPYGRSARARLVVPDSLCSRGIKVSGVPLQ